MALECECECACPPPQRPLDEVASQKQERKREKEDIRSLFGNYCFLLVGLCHYLIFPPLFIPSLLLSPCEYPWICLNFLPSSFFLINSSSPTLPMSLASVKSPKHCGANKQELNVHKRYKKLFLALSAFLSIISLLILLLWVILHPSKPEFGLKEADVYQLNLIDLHLLNSSIQLTLSSKNPNQKVGIYYEQLQVYAAYKGQQITVGASLPGFYQGHKETNLLTAFLAGSGVPVAPSFGYEVGRDQSAGRFVLNIKAMGRLRWKVGSWVSGRYRFNVDCVAVMPFGPTLPTAPLTLKQPTRCSTTL